MLAVLLSAGLLLAPTAALAATPASSSATPADTQPPCWCLSFHYVFHTSPTLPESGPVIPYQMEFANNSNVDSTKSEIAFNVSKLRDDTELDPSSFSAETGSITVDGDVVVWRGPLDAGEKVLIRFNGVWTGAGDGLTFPEVLHYGYAG
jgi:hypothetical protein